MNDMITLLTPLDAFGPLTKRSFQAVVNEATYFVHVFVAADGKWFETHVNDRYGDPLDIEGNEGDLREHILETIDAQWDTLLAGRS
jgi:hypothetical protein